MTARGRFLGPFRLSAARVAAPAAVRTFLGSPEDSCYSLRAFRARCRHMNIAFTAKGRALFEDECRRQGAPDLGIQVGFLYGCGGAGFRVVFTPSPQGSHLVEVDGVRIALDAESRARLDRNDHRLGGGLGAGSRPPASRCSSR